MKRRSARRARSPPTASMVARRSATWLATAPSGWPLRGRPQASPSTSRGSAVQPALEVVLGLEPGNQVRHAGHPRAHERALADALGHPVAALPAEDDHDVLAVRAPTATKWARSSSMPGRSSTSTRCRSRVGQVRARLGERRLARCPPSGRCPSRDRSRAPARAPDRPPARAPRSCPPRACERTETAIRPPMKNTTMIAPMIRKISPTVDTAAGAWTAGRGHGCSVIVIAR